MPKAPAQKRKRVAATSESEIQAAIRAHDFLAPVFAQYPIEVASAQGVWLTSSRGERVLDLYGGHAVAGLGYGHPAWTAALARQAEACQFQSNAVAMRIRAQAARRLVRFSRLPFASAFLVNSGAEANENALKVALRMTGRAHVAAIEGGFHGRTAAAGAVTWGARERWYGFPRTPFDVSFIPRGDRGGDRGHQDRAPPRACAADRRVYPPDLHRGPGRCPPGRRAPGGAAHHPPRERNPGGAPRVLHPHRHGQRPAHPAPAARVHSRGAARRHAARCAARSAPMKRFVDLADFEREEVLSLLELARRLEKQPEPRALAGRILALLFLNPSLRTLASFQAAMARLGGNSFVINPGRGSWQLETRPGVVMDGAAAEHVREGIPALASYCDALGIRAFAEGKDLASDLAETTFNAMASLTEKPLINLESALNHPCQALADWKTLDDLAVPRAGRFVLSWAWHPRPLPLAVPAAALHMAALRGMQVIVLRPEGFALPPVVMERARQAAARSGGSVRESAEREEALDGADVLYVKEWAATERYGDAEADARLRSALRSWCVRNDWFTRAAPECRLMHCLPVRRNSAIADEALDSARSVVQREAANRLPVQMAVLHQMLRS